MMIMTENSKLVDRFMLGNKAGFYVRPTCQSPLMGPDDNNMSMELVVVSPF